MFRDIQHAWNPTQEEIKIWAYSDEQIPSQDWELAVNNVENIPMICSFIDDDKCQKKTFFLSSLYVFTGDIVASEIESDIADLTSLLDKVEKGAKTEELKTWIYRSKHLISYPQEYDYDYWGLFSKYVFNV
ncbi:hypothetical protein [Paenibacillus sp. sgz500992]|uniref:hypothetical protein n=1 Tax=Paenibacillus sp. sgz500992 TaxID=3242476 RepID=UPI0036D3FFDF